jgi:kynurenine 3-monooxygenase
MQFMFVSMARQHAVGAEGADAGDNQASARILSSIIEGKRRVKVVMQNVVVVGGGLAGLAVSGLLAQSGFAVTVVEAQDPERPRIDEPKSINLALSTRGLQTLAALGLRLQVMQYIVPMYGRRMHLAGGADEFHPYDLIGTQAIYSIRRSTLWQLLRRAAETQGVRLQFDRRCAGIDFDERVVELVDRKGQKSRLAYGALIGADGAQSAVRRALVARGEVIDQTTALPHGYKELFIPAAHAVGLDANALHIWPRDDLMLIALPNIDGSFTVTIFLPLEGDRSPRALRTPEALLSLFRREFPDAIALIPNLLTAFSANPLGRLTTVKCDRWSSANAVLLIGDAAHAMAPFYGQGMNCALEDCIILMRSVEEFGDHWADVFAAFECERRPDADAIGYLSEANYAEMSRKVAEDDFRLKREIKGALQRYFPQHFIPLYAMVSFSTLPYAEALARGAAQDAIVDRLAPGLKRIGDLDLELARRLLGGAILASPQQYLEASA